MYQFNIRLADKVISATCEYETTLGFCKDYITDDKAEIFVSVSHEELLIEQQKERREREIEGVEAKAPSLAYLETLALYRKIAEALVSFGIILFHGSALSIDGEVYLFTAKSGTGKSTHTRLWREVYGDRVIMVNDDKPLIKIGSDGVTVYGTPWNGKHRLGANIKAPLKAICILERASENAIKKEDALRVFPEILGQTYRFSNVIGMQKTLSLVDTLLRRVNVYRLGCNMDPEAAVVSYEGMKG